MKKLLLTIIIASSVAALAGSCASQKDAAPGWVKTGIERGTVQLHGSALKFDAENVFPRSYKDGKYKLVDKYDWTSGFFPGTLWELYELTGDKALKEQAAAYTAKLDGIQFYKKTHDLGFMVFCSFGNQYASLNDEYSAQAIVDASNSLISRMDPAVGQIRSWDFGEWNYPVIIDNLMNLEMLFWASRHTGDPKYRDVAVMHADKTMKNHYRDDYSSYHVVSYNNDGTVESRGTFQGFADETAWARGQAWGLYGYVMCYRETGYARYLEQAENIAAFLMNHPRTPEDLIPYWDYDAPDILNAPRDASAAAIIASALLEMSTIEGARLADDYFSYAERILKSLSSDKYLAKEGANGGFIIMHCVGHLPANSEIDTPLNYADYYYIEALKRYLNIIGVSIPVK